MAYVRPNYKTKKELMQALRDGQPVQVFEPGVGKVPFDGKVFLEGPHYPEPHTWYAEGTMIGGKLRKVK